MLCYVNRVSRDSDVQWNLPNPTLVRIQKISGHLCTEIMPDRDKSRLYIQVSD